jgi:hypothetical protein
MNLANIRKRIELARKEIKVENEVHLMMGNAGWVWTPEWIKILWKLTQKSS